MSPPPDNPPPDAGQACPGRDQLLSRLEQLLSEQLALAEREDFEAMLAAAGAIDELIRRTTEAPQPLAAAQVRRLSEILKRHYRIGLILAQKRDELAARLAHAGRGRKTLRAYRQGSP